MAIDLYHVWLLLCSLMGRHSVPLPTALCRTDSCHCLLWLHMWFRNAKNCTITSMITTTHIATVYWAIFLKQWQRPSLHIDLKIGFSCGQTTHSQSLQNRRLELSGQNWRRLQRFLTPATNTTRIEGFDSFFAICSLKYQKSINRYRIMMCCFVFWTSL